MAFQDLHNDEAEVFILSAILSKNDTIADITLKEEDFYNPVNAEIYAELRAMYTAGKPIDLVTFANWLKERNRLEGVGGLINLTAIYDKGVLYSAIGDYQKIIKDFAIRRKLYRVGAEIANSAIDITNDIGEQVNAGNQKILGIAVNDGDTDEATVGKQDIINAFNKLYDDKTGVHTGFEELDKMLYRGLREGEMVVLAGRPSMGKTALSLNIMNNLLKQGKKVFLFSLETTKTNILQRLMMSKACVSYEELTDGDFEKTNNLLAAVEAINKYKDNLAIDDSSYHSIDSMTTKLQKHILRHGKLDLIVIDHLQLINVSGFHNNRQAEISYASRNIKMMAKRFNCPIIILSQLSRAIEGRGDKRPVLSDLRESGAIEQDADIVMMLYRESYYDKEKEDDGQAEIIVAKQKDGKTGIVPMLYISKYMRFENAPRPWEKPPEIEENDIPL